MGRVKSFGGKVPLGNPGGSNVPPIKPFPMSFSKCLTMSKEVTKIPLNRLPKSLYITMAIVSAVFTMIYTYRLLEGEYSFGLIASALALILFTLLFFKIRRFHFTLYENEFLWQLPGMSTPSRVEIPKGSLKISSVNDDIILSVGKNTLKFTLSPLNKSEQAIIVTALRGKYCKGNQ